MWQERLYNIIVCEYEHQSGTLMINFNVDLAKIQFHRAKNILSIQHGNWMQMYTMYVLGALNKHTQINSESKALKMWRHFYRKSPKETCLLPQEAIPLKISSHTFPKNINSTTKCQQSSRMDHLKCSHWQRNAAS